MFGEILTFFPLKKNSHTELPYIRVKKVYKICDLVDFSGIYSLAFIFGADPYLYFLYYILYAYESFSGRVAEVTHPDDSWVIWQISMKPTEIGTSLQYYKWNFRKNMCVT